MKIRHLAAGALILTLAACGQSEPRSFQYFEAHLDEAQEVVAGCRDGSVGGHECYNAEVAVSKAKARERTERLSRKLKQQ